MNTLRPLLGALVLSLSLLGPAACKITCPPPQLPPCAGPTPAAAAPAASVVTPLPTVVFGDLAKAAGTTDKGTSGHNYVEVYERFLIQWRYFPIKIFEIGIEAGGSLNMWEQYFPEARIFGVDIEDKSAMARARVKTIVGDQSKRKQLQKAIDVSGGDIDLLVDDGGHTMEQQQVSLGFLFKFVKPGGYYILEDIHTSIPALWSGYGVEPDGSNTTLRMLEDYMRSGTPTFKSKYMLPEEMKYLDENVEFVNLLHRVSDRSLTAIIKKRK
jgi:hypothetical protein